MGTHCSSGLPRGHIFKSKSITMKLILLTALAAVALAEPEAEAQYYGYNPGFYGYGHQQNWPSARTYGFSSTCWGCRGKRSADADAEPAYYGYGLPGRSFAHFGGHYLGKRSAEAEAEPRYYGYGSYGYNFGSYGYPYGYRAYGRGVAAHPTGNFFTYRSVQGFGK